MWRQVFNTLIAVLLVVCIALVLRLLSNPISFHFFEYWAEDPSHQQAQTDGDAPGFFGDFPNWLQFFAAAPIALFSYWLFRLGKLQSHMLKRANRTAAHALEAAKEANEVATRSAKAAEAATVVAERAAKAAEDGVAITRESARGAMALDNFTIEPSGEYTFGVINAGPGPLIITGLGVRPCTNLKILERERASINTEMFRPLMSGQVWQWLPFREGQALDPLTGMGHNLWPSGRPSEHGELVLAIAVQYRSMGHSYLFRAAIHIPPNVRFSRISPDPRYTSDEPISAANAPQNHHAAQREQSIARKNRPSA
ncbi:MAG: hypothetical protein H6591_03940 [Flavobacteriales bacterium]|nr:hypothetical protein [Flavobacteriales bacterium]